MSLTYSWALPRSGGVSTGGGSSGVSLPYSTTFPATENPISQGGIWVNGGAVGLDWTNIQTNGSGAFTTAYTTPPANAHYNDAIAHLSLTFANNQYAQGTVSRAAGYTAGHEIELLLRFNITAHSASGYEIYWSTNDGINIVRWNGALDSFTPLNNATRAAADGDVLYAEIVGSTITVKVNGSTVVTATDTTFASGHAGLGCNCYDTGAGVFTSYGWKAFSAGNL